MIEQNGILIIFAIIAIALVAAPYVISWRMTKLGSAVVKGNGMTSPVSRLYSSWATIRGKNFLTRQTMLCKISVYGDRIGMKLLWGPERFISYSDIREIHRLLSGARTTGIKILPSSFERLEEITFSGIADAPKFLNAIKEQGKIEIREVADTRGILDLIR
jgi:hypothetical protein